MTLRLRTSAYIKKLKRKGIIYFGSPRKKCTNMFYVFLMSVYFTCVILILSPLSLFSWCQKKFNSLSTLDFFLFHVPQILHCFLRDTRNIFTIYYTNFFFPKKRMGLQSMHSNRHVQIRLQIVFVLTMLF